MWYLLIKGRHKVQRARSRVHGLGRVINAPFYGIQHHATMQYRLIELAHDVENNVESVGNCMDWQTLIGNYAFPIACCLYLFWSQEKERERHKEESDKWVEALNNNTKVLEAIKERIGNG